MKTKWFAVALLALPFVLFAQLKPGATDSGKNPFNLGHKLIEQIPLEGLENSDSSLVVWQKKVGGFAKLQASQTAALKTKIADLEKRVAALEEKLAAPETQKSN